MKKDELQEVLRLHKMWLNDEDGGKRADLRRANLEVADLRGANLEGADLDCSCFPLWCGSKGMKVDRRLAAQIAAHFCALDCDDNDYQELARQS